LLPKVIGVALCFAALGGAALAQECKLTFAVGYADGKSLQTGLTQPQRKYWEKEGTKMFKGLCLDFKKPDYLILWSVGLSGKELVETGVGAFNRNRQTGEATTNVNQASTDKISTTDSRWMDSTVMIRGSSQVRAKAEYWILDLTQTSGPVIRTGQGFRQLPSDMGVANRPGEKVNAQDMSSTIPDETEALENALKWLKKQKKL
jgi:hypothetical protein